MIAATERQYSPVTLYKNMHLRIHITKIPSGKCIFKNEKGMQRTSHQFLFRNMAQQSLRIGEADLMA
jgi:hypothetical protein